MNFGKKNMVYCYKILIFAIDKPNRLLYNGKKGGESMEQQHLMKTVTAPGIGDPSTDIRIEWHQVGNGWEPVILHWHNYCEFELILSGRGTHTLNNVPLPVHRGSAYICLMSDFHKIKNAPDETLILANLKFSETLIQEPLLKQIYAISDHLYCDFAEEKDVLQIVSLLQLLEDVHSNDYSARTEVKRIILECTLNQIIAFFLLHCDGENRNSSNRKENKMQKAISFIHRNFTKNISQADVAEQVGLSVNYFSTMFKNQMHSNYSAYLLNLKLNYARNLIVSEHFTKVQAIASKIGFSSTPYFIKAFKKKFDVTPKEMIETVQKPKKGQRIREPFK